MSEIRVLIVDDHDIVRAGISRLLGDVRGISVAGEAQSGEDAIKLIKELKPDVVLMDVQMAGIGGLEATKRALQINPDIKVIALTMHVEEPLPTKIMQAGAAGYLTKSSRIEEIINAIRTVYSGKRYLSSTIAQQLALKNVADFEDSPLDLLSDRELQVMMMITSGKKVQEISDTLHLSPKTVNSYRYRLFHKLGVESDVELTRLAMRHGMLGADILPVSS